MNKTNTYIMRPLKYSEPNETNEIIVMGYEPYFSKYVQVAKIYLPHPKRNHLITNGKYHILHNHGYFPKHTYGNRVVKYCQKL